jgi:peptidoglycan/LPS O-acetylase OafA/YrhL
MKSKTIYFPGLNGLRAYAAIAVVMYHISLALSVFNLDPYIFGTNDKGRPTELMMGPRGVSIFFALSGFLITYLLQAEKEEKDINIKKFYFRRILRIWPLYYLYLSIAIVLSVILGLAFNFNDIFYYVFFAANIPLALNTANIFLSHYWSLGVEEQFYLFWPVINKKTKYTLATTIILIVVLMSLKYVVPVLYPKSNIARVFDMVKFQCMMIGAAGALIYKSNNKIFLKITDNKLVQSLCWITIFLVTINKFHIASIIDNEIISVVATVIIIGQIGIENRIFNLEIKVLDFLGRISYGIYVIHPLIIYLFSKFLGHIDIYTPAKYALVYTSILATTIILAYVSFTYFEQYFLRLKKRFEVIKSSATAGN